MFTLTNNTPPYVHMGCGCGREYIIEEMYLSFAAKKAICRFCTRDSINDMYCPSCLEHQSLKEARIVDCICPRCFMCPVCFSKTIINKYVKDNEKIHYLTCMACKWDSLSIGITAINIMDIFQTQKKTNDKNIVYDYLLEVFNNNQKAIMKREKRELRQKKQKNLAEDRDFDSTKSQFDKNKL